MEQFITTWQRIQDDNLKSLWLFLEEYRRKGYRIVTVAVTRTEADTRTGDNPDYEATQATVVLEKPAQE